MKRLGNLHSGKFPFFEISADAKALRCACVKRNCSVAMSLHKHSNATVAVFVVEGAGNIRRAHDALFKPVSRRQQQKVETRRVNRRMAKLLASRAERILEGAK